MAILNEASPFGFLSNLVALAKGGAKTYNDVKDLAASTRSTQSRRSYSSIAKAASDLIAVFPILCSSNVSKETASIITKVIEQQGSTYLQMMLIAANLTTAIDGFEYLKQYHQNIKLGSSLDDYATAINRLADKPNNEGVFVSPDKIKSIVQTLKESYTQYYDDDCSSFSLNDFVVNESADGYYVSFHPVSEERSRTLRSVLEANSSGSKPAQTPKPSSTPNETESQTTPPNNVATKIRHSLELRDSDARKINEAVPSLLIVRFTTAGKVTGGDNVVNEFIVGVKAKLLPTDYMEILNKIYLNNKDGQGLTNIVRFTSGELSFFKDLLFAVDRAKNDVLSIKKGSREPIWKVLEWRALKSSENVRSNRPNDAYGITTVCITNEDADYLFKEENVDIRNPKVARRFMASYNLLCLVIVNDAEEVAWFMYDNGEGYFEKLAYTMLERDTGDGQYRKILNLMTKMR